MPTGCPEAAAEARQIDDWEVRGEAVATALRDTAAGNCASAPCDQHGHGTHTMGTMVGDDNQIGVAPEANWIAAN